MTRNYFDPLYSKWRSAVRKRDGNKCRWPGCNVRRGLQCHHITPWAGNVWLRYSVANGITLCRKHHKQVTGQEYYYIGYLLSLIK